MNDFFDPQTGGLTTLYGWIGQIADESTWIGNHANQQFKHKIHTKNDIAGASRRVKVQIIGKHVEVKDILDDQLPMAEVLLPTTAGSGHGGSHQTPNLKQGMYVFGFYKDGKNGTEPIIVGVLPNDPRVPLFGGNPSNNFTPRSGCYGVNGSTPISNSYIKLEGSTPLIQAEGASVSPNQATVAHSDQKNDGKRPFYLPVTINCEGPSGELQGFQKFLKSFLIDVKRAKRVSQQFAGAASNLNSNITSIIAGYSNLIAAVAKSLISKIRGFIVNRLNKELTKLFELLPPNLRPGASRTSEAVNNTIQCVFNKIISALLGLIKSLLTQLIDRYINAPLCAAESFISNLISSFLGDLTSGILGALSGIAGVTLNVASLLFQAFDILIGVLEFLSCDPDLDCQILDEWSFWDGSSLRVESLGAKPGIARDLIGFASSDRAFGGGVIPACNVSQIPCGPPSLVFLGGSGSSASGNVVVGLTGQIMGVDLLTGGRYTSPVVSTGSTTYESTPPQINATIFDECGIGGGSNLVTIVEKYDKDQTKSGDGTTEEYFVSNVVVIDSGFDYLNSFDGSTGGDGVLFSGKCDTIINTDVYSPGKEVKVKRGQTIYLPRRTTVEVTNNQGDVVQILTGQGQITPIEITENGKIITPECISAETESSGTPTTGTPTTGTPTTGTPTTGISTERINSTIPSILVIPDSNEKFEGNFGFTQFNFNIKRSGDLSKKSSLSWRISGYGKNPTTPSDFKNSRFPSGTLVFEPDEINKTITIDISGDVDIEKDEKFVLNFFRLFNAKIDRKSKLIGSILNDDEEVEDGSESNTYDVYVCLEDLAILNEGVNYSSGDIITINPNNGAKFEPIIDEFGRIKEVRLIAKGCGFVDVPKISVLSETGINANIVPVFSFTRINIDGDFDSLDIPLGAPVVNVVDCVGKLKR